jgi:hypothetical protein
LAEQPLGLGQLMSVISTAAELPHQGLLALNAALPEIVEGRKHRAIDVHGCPGPCRERYAAEVLATQTHTNRDAKERAQGTKGCFHRSLSRLTL